MAAAAACLTAAATLAAAPARINLVNGGNLPALGFASRLHPASLQRAVPQWTPCSPLGVTGLPGAAIYSDTPQKTEGADGAQCNLTLYGAVGQVAAGRLSQVSQWPDGRGPMVAVWNASTLAGQISNGLLTLSRGRDKSSGNPTLTLSLGGPLASDTPAVNGSSRGGAAVLAYLDLAGIFCPSQPTHRAQGPPFNVSETDLYASTLTHRSSHPNSFHRGGFTKVPRAAAAGGCSSEDGVPFGVTQSGLSQLASASAEIDPDGSAVLRLTLRLAPSAAPSGELPPALQGVLVTALFRLPVGVPDLQVQLSLSSIGPGRAVFAGDGKYDFGGLRFGWGPALTGSFRTWQGDQRGTVTGAVTPGQGLNVPMQYSGTGNTWLALQTEDTARTVAVATAIFPNTSQVCQKGGSSLSEWSWYAETWEAKFVGISPRACTIPLTLDPSIAAEPTTMEWWLRVPPPRASLGPVDTDAAALATWLEHTTLENSTGVGEPPQPHGPQSTVSVYVNGVPVAAGVTTALGLTGFFGAGAPWLTLNGTLTPTTAPNSTASAAVLSASPAGIAEVVGAGTFVVRGDAVLGDLVMTAQVAAMTGRGELAVEIRQMDSPEWIEVGRLQSAGTLQRSLSELQGLGPLGNRTSLVLRLSIAAPLDGPTLTKADVGGGGKASATNAVTATLTQLSVAPRAPVAPVLVSPRPAQRVTDVAVHYSWFRVSGVSQYDIEVCRTAECEQGSVLHYHYSYDAPYLSFFPGSNASGPTDFEVLPPGVYWWRVRGVADTGQHGEWGTLGGSFTVDDDHSVGTPCREVSPTSPIIFITCWLGQTPADIPAFDGAVPESLANMSSIVFSDRIHSPLLEFVAPSAWSNLTRPMSIGVATVTGPGHPANGWESLADLEYLFQTMPNVRGTRQGELMWAFFQPGSGKQAYMHALIVLSAKYGRYFVWGDGDGEAWQWQRLLADPWWQPFLRSKAPFVVLEPKNNIYPGFWAAQSALYGAYLSGVTTTLGAWDEAWYWTSAGFHQLNQTTAPDTGDLNAEPAIFRHLYFLLAAQQGATVYSIDGQSSTTDPCDTTPGGAPCTCGGTGRECDLAAVWYRNGTAKPAMSRFVEPFFRALATQGLIASRAEALAQIKVAVSIPNQTGLGPDHGNRSYGAYQALYAGTYGFRPPPLGGPAVEILPNTGRFGIIPILPFPLSTLNGSAVRNLSTLQDVDLVRKTFETAHPPVSNGSSLVLLVRKPSSGFFAMSPYENWNVTTDYAITGPPLFAPAHARAGVIVLGVRGTNRVHSYVMGKMRTPSELWLQLQSRNANDTTTVVITCSAKPSEVRIDPPETVVTNSWAVIGGGPAGEQTIVVSHDPGAVEVTLVGNPSRGAEGSHA